MKTSLFGTSGVRGVVNKDLTPELCKRVGQALGSLLPPQSAVCLATDSRLSRELIKGAVTEGLIESDINVALLDVVPTPALALLTREMGFEAGVMITASHNPPEFNGIKLFNKDAIGFSRAQEEELENIYYSNRFRTGRMGAVESVPRMRERYFEHILSRVGSWKFNRDLRLIVDPGNGAASGFVSEIFKRLQLKAIPFNDVPDGRFPGRSPEPKEDTLQGTIKFLKQKNADLAICFDGDADRVVFCDQKGFLGFNEMAAFISRNAINRSGKKTVATTVETGILLDLAVEDVGGKVIRGKVGDVYAAHLARENDAALGVESVGVYILPEIGYYPDSIFASIMLLSSIADVAEIRRFIATMPPVFFAKDKVDCPNEMKASAMSKLEEGVPALAPLAVNNLDGLRLEYDDAWTLIRASGTEPAIRVLAESMSKSYTNRLLSAGLAMAREAVKGATV
jgi:phosphoglucosamine mutase